MKITQENVYRILELASGQGVTTKEIIIAMRQKKRRKAMVRKVLKALSKEKICYKKNNRYYLFESEEGGKQIGKTPVPRKKTAPRLKSKGGDYIGRVLKNKEGFYLYSYNEQTTYPIARGRVGDCMHGDLVGYRLYSPKNGHQVADVRELIDRRINLVKGVARTSGKGKAVFFPLSVRFPKGISIENRVAFEEGSEKEVWFEYASFLSSGKISGGRAKPVLKSSTSISPEVSQILDEYNIPSGFPNRVEEDCQNLPAVVRRSKNSDRVDLREFPFVTIDGKDAKDFDDAIFAQKEKGGYRIWISIADVSAYVKRGSEIDKEAFCRGTSTYLPGMVFPMLPELLSNGLCSLKAGVNRKTLTCEVKIDQRGKAVDSKIYPSINKIACRLTYNEVDQLFELDKIKPKKSFPEIETSLKLYREIMKVLRKRRILKGFISFNLPETVYRFNTSGEICSIEKGYQTEAMQVIEQFMLLANETVARFCARKKLPIIWRNHPKPLPDKRKRLIQLFWNSHIKAGELNDSKDFSRALRLISKHKEKDFLEYSMLRTMPLAVYETERFGHFGLGETHYCHFTSPIRRFPDLMVHRALKDYLRKHKPLKIPEYIAATASSRERLATDAERRASRLIKLKFMESQIGERFDVRISGLVSAGFFVEVEQPYVEGFVSFSTILDDHYEFDERLFCVRGRHLSRKLTIGDKMQVLLCRLDWSKLSLEFDWICWKE